MEESIRKALSAPFPADAVKNRRGNFGKPINYVDGAAIIARLNDCFGGDWSFSIVEHHVLATGEVLVHGKLTVLDKISKEAFGRGIPAISRETGEVLSEADAYKAAATDALKKCATMLGVAAYLYSDDVPEQQAEEKPQPRKQDKPTNDARDRLTQKQLSALWSMGRSLKLSAEAVRKRSVEMYGVQPENLTKNDASAFISMLGEEIDKSKRRAA
ncbi:MAG: Rad52/Rad22 family DNA repair protein [Deltaproteobacteria bacterium]|nr:Rad52/Rad22 family DNA repair protein [Deltaproteobacteria bacterium]